MSETPKVLVYLQGVLIGHTDKFKSDDRNPTIVVNGISYSLYQYEVEVVDGNLVIRILRAFV